GIVDRTAWRAQLRGTDDRPGSLELSSQHALGRGRESRGWLVERGAEARPRVGLRRAVVPATGRRVEPVERQQLPGVVGEQMDRVDDVLEHLFADELVEADANEAELRAHVAA